MTIKAEKPKTQWPLEFTPRADIVKIATPKPAASAPADEREGYYGVPLLKRPKWRWEIALYFFFEGVSAGSFLLGALADLSGNKCLRKLARTAYDVSFLTLLPCPPMLIADLGRPERFHHMLRLFKPTSPMNLGAWTLTGFSAPVTAIAAFRLIGDGSSNDENKLMLRSGVGAAGLPFALAMISYPGVLLSTTSTRSEEHTSELQSLTNLVCRLLLEKKKKKNNRLQKKKKKKEKYKHNNNNQTK